MSTQTRDDLWDRFYTRCGPQSLDKMLTDGSDWNEVLKTGEADLARGLQYTTITFGEDRSALDLGCGAGRLSHVLGRRFGRVLGVDTSEGMIREAYKHRLLENTSFLVTDDRLNLPATVGTFDTIFSYEVFHYLTREQLKHYFRVAYSLLKPNGELIFQLNVQPIRATTRISFGLRSLMKLIGIEQWHGWPNDAAFQRKCHPPEWLSSQLAQTGFVVDGSRGTLRQTWVRAVRPATDH